MGGRLTDYEAIVDQSNIYNIMQCHGAAGTAYALGPIKTVRLMFPCQIPTRAPDPQANMYIAGWDPYVRTCIYIPCHCV